MSKSHGSGSIPIPDDGFDAAALAAELSDYAVHLIAALPPDPLQLFSGGERVGIDVAARDGTTKMAHLSLDGFHEGGSGVLEQVPTIGNLHRPGGAFVRAFATSAAAVAAHDRDLGMACEPVRDGGALPIRQEIDGAATLEVADDRSIALAL